MMNRLSISVRIPTIIIIAVFFTHSVFSLKCYICNSIKDVECSEPFPPSKYLKECPRNPSIIASDMHLETKLHQVATAMSPKIIQTVTPARGEAAGNRVSYPLENNAADMSTINSTSFSTKPTPNTAVNKDEKNVAINFKRTARGTEEEGYHEGIEGVNNPMSLPLSKERTQFCRKITFYIGSQNNGPNNTLRTTERVLRSCGWITEDGPVKNLKTKLSCKISSNKAVRMKECVCSNGDGCNAGSHLMFSMPLRLIFLGIMTADYLHIL